MSIEAEFHQRVKFLSPQDQAKVMAAFRDTLGNVDVPVIRTTLGLLASVVKSGESWSSQCEESHRRAVAAAKKLTVIPK